MLKKFLSWFMGYLSQNKNNSASGYLKETHNNIAESYNELSEKVKRLEQILEEKTKIADDLKSAFLRNIYHEIRTPMNSIVGFTNLLSHKDLSEEQRKKFDENIKKSSQQFLKLIDDLIEASILDSGYFKIVNGDCNLTKLIDELHSYFTVHNIDPLKSNIALVQNPDSQYMDITIYTDKKMLFDIISILISNAFKFTRKGVIEYGYKVLNNNQVMFFVKDSGVGGIDKFDKSIFKSFTKAENCFENTNKGFGLGLSIAHSKVKLLRGDIWVESNELKGTTFKFTVPLTESDAANINKKIENSRNKEFSKVS
jgi:signal transduction histidine kinase